MAIKQLTLDIKLRDDATFGNFVGTAGAVLADAGDWCYLWGTPGSGRSHLLQALCHQHPKSIYLNGLRRLSAEVLQGLEVMDVVCIDDVDEVMGDRDWEEGLFHLLNHVRDQGRRIVVSAPEPATRLAIELADLRSRLIAAESIRTDNLNDDEKLQVLMQRADNRGFRLGEEVGRFILSRASRDMRQLFDLLEKIELETLRQGKRVTIPFVKQTLSL